MKEVKDTSLGITSVGGGLKDMKATISQDQMAKLFELLQAPYSNPIGSIVRETTTNAWDAHVEIGSMNPIRIILDYDKDGSYIEFVDIGMGMSPERIEKTYVNYLETTKDNSNDQSGYFGIGSKSPLSYASHYYITTVFDKVKYEYIVRKDDDGIPIVSLIDENKVTQRNGTTIKMYIEKADAGSFSREIKQQLRFFEHIYVTDRLNMHDMFSNDFKIIKGEHFVTKIVILPGTSDTKYKLDVTASHIMDYYSNYVSIGQVAYPIDAAQFDKYIHNTYGDQPETQNRLKMRLEVLKRFGIAARVPIGEIPVTLTRESIKYNKITFAKLVTYFEDAFIEVMAKNMHTNGSNLTAAIKGCIDTGSHKRLGQILADLGGSHTFKLTFMDEMEVAEVSGIQGLNLNKVTYRGAGYTTKEMYDISQNIYNNVFVPKAWLKTSSGGASARSYDQMEAIKSNLYRVIVRNDRCSDLQLDGVRYAIHRCDAIDDTTPKRATSMVTMYQARQTRNTPNGIIYVPKLALHPTGNLEPYSIEHALSLLIEYCFQATDSAVMGTRGYYSMISNQLPPQAFVSLNKLIFSTDELINGIIFKSSDFWKYIDDIKVRSGLKGPIKVSQIRKAATERFVFIYTSNDAGTQHSIDSLLRDKRFHNSKIEAYVAPLMIQVDQKTLDDLKDKCIPGVYFSDRVRDRSTILPKQHFKHAILAQLVARLYPKTYAYMTESGEPTGTEIALYGYPEATFVRKYITRGKYTKSVLTNSQTVTRHIFKDNIDDYITEYPELVSIVDMCATFEESIIKHEKFYQKYANVSSNVRIYFYARFTKGRLFPVRFAIGQFNKLKSKIIKNVS
jgi:hypothetical protein